MYDACLAQNEVKHTRTFKLGACKSYDTTPIPFSGEKLTKEEAKNLMKELCDPEDDEGFMPFMRELILFKIMTSFTLAISHYPFSFPGTDVQCRILTQV